MSTLLACELFVARIVIRSRTGRETACVNGSVSCGRLRTVTVLAALALLLACNAPVPDSETPDSGSPAPEQSAPDPDTAAAADPPAPAPPPFPSAGELLPEEFDGFWEPRFDDLDGIVARRMLRVLVSLGGYQYFFDDGRPRGATFELLQKFEDFLNQKLKRRTLRVEVVPVPVSRDQLIRDLVAGYADVVASDITITPDRAVATGKIEFHRDPPAGESFARESRHARTRHSQCRPA